MLVLMNGYNQIGGSNTFLMVFSCCAGNGCGDDAWRRRETREYVRGWEMCFEVIGMDGNMKQLVFGVCVALLVLGAFVGAGALARAGTREEAAA